MVQKCCSCGSDRTSNVKLHGFPQESVLRQKWISAMSKGPINITQYTRICSNHFTENDYYPSSFGNPILKPDAVPSIFVSCKKSLLSNQFFLCLAKMNTSEKVIQTLTTDQISQIVTEVQKDLDDEIVKTKQTLELIDQNIYTCITNLKKLRRSIIISHYANMKNNTDGHKNSQRDAILKNLECEDEAKDLSVFMNSLNNVSTQIKNEPKSSIEQISKPIPQNVSSSVNFIPPTGLVELSYVIGNTVTINDVNNEMKYKWTVYVRNVDEGLDNLIFIDKVTFFLHESYEPNHIIDIIQKPFSLTRHGWGEFVVRLRLYFKGNMSVQTDVYHKLSLDKNISVGIPMVAKEQTVKYKLLLHK